MKFVSFLCLALTMSAADLIPLRQTDFSSGASGWRAWSARPEIAPKTFIDSGHGRQEHGSLAVSGNSNAAVYGGWEYVARGIMPGKWYRFAAYYRAEGLQTESLQV